MSEFAPHQDNQERSDYGVQVKIAEGYSTDEERHLSEAVAKTLAAVDTFTSGQSSKIFDGLQIVIGEDVDGGGLALPEENKVLLNGRKMLLSVAEMREVSGAYDPSDLNVFPDVHRPAGAMEYNLAHEMGHILDGQTQSGTPYHRVSAVESPTRYGREFDRFNSENKDHEAFADGFAHMVYGMPVSEAMEAAVKRTISDRILAILS